MWRIFTYTISEDSPHVNRGVKIMGIKTCRLQAGLRQDDVAKKMKIDRSTVAKWETNESMPRADKLPELARILGCTIDELFNEKGEE